MENAHQPSTSRVRRVHSPNIPCRGLCKRKRHCSQVIEIAYTFMAAVRNSLGDGLLLTFVNKTSDDVDLIWLDYEGDEIPIIKFRSGDSYRLSAVTIHNFCCRNTATGRYYLLNNQLQIFGHTFKGTTTKKSHLIHMTAPKIPLSLREAALNVSAGRLKDRRSAFKLALPASIQTELYQAKALQGNREYYSIRGEPGFYRKSYGERDEGPWIYPTGMDWSSFDQ